jgi:hypothetical protein
MTGSVRAGDDEALFARPALSIRDEIQIPRNTVTELKVFRRDTVGWLAKTGGVGDGMLLVIEIATFAVVILMLIAT